ncbi:MULTISPECIES: NAD(P)H-dependent oxidoreductase [unclassified Gordonia (in: high G+C Gram-positive bacteria)]|uniref:NAD(P)H-dependent oxidoreductase n=1 Tax=unclassified Gordonia (in: high G+C Gram-positive bacteria) TaxID=2657482 RepID=UPI001F1048FF|nr:NAD(P)H-dependent oxidoreductase [Gordonia sp. ABSL49_1]MCH5643761.1 NAD(P)H-dependent oxidoreductase [Gordonia sp. ABSL49_1]
MSDRVVELVALVGSLREASINRRLAQLAAENAPGGVHVTVVDDLGTLPFYSEDVDPASADDTELDAGVARLRGVVGGADGVLIVTPEYNGTIPAALKNAIDWLSRPYGSGALQGKPVGVIGAALGRYAGTWSREDTRKSVGIAGGRVIEDVELGVQTSALPDAGVEDPALVEQVVVAVNRLVDEVAVRA